MCIYFHKFFFVVCVCLFVVFFFCFVSPYNKDRKRKSALLLT